MLPEKLSQKIIGRTGDLWPYPFVCCDFAGVLYFFRMFSGRACPTDFLNQTSEVHRMSQKPGISKMGIRLSLMTALGLLLLLAFIGLKFKAVNPDLQNRARNMVKKQETLSRMRINLIRSVDIEKGAVMADTDELSRSLAEESMQAADLVERDRHELSLLIDHDRVDKEMATLREFDGCWTELRKIDKVLLDFAVENSNIKAANLSFTQGSQALGRFKQNLTELMSRYLHRPQYCQILKLASDALTSAAEVHYLHAPHISAANDKEMDRIEADIKQSDEVIRTSLMEMERFLSEGDRPLLQQASDAYKDFQGITAGVLQLSRQNTNIKSFELSLGRKRKVTAQCDEILSNLEGIVRSRAFEATR